MPRGLSTVIAVPVEDGLPGCRPGRAWANSVTCPEWRLHGQMGRACTACPLSTNGVYQELGAFPGAFGPGHRSGSGLRLPCALCKVMLIQSLPHQRFDDGLPAHVKIPSGVVQFLQHGSSCRSPPDHSCADILKEKGGLRAGSVSSHRYGRQAVFKSSAFPSWQPRQRVGLDKRTFA